MAPRRGRARGVGGSGDRFRHARRLSPLERGLNRRRQTVPVIRALPPTGGCPYNACMPHPVIFDRTLLRARRARAAALGPATFLLERVADDIAERLVGGAAQVRSRGRSRHAERCGAARACGARRRDRRGRSSAGPACRQRPAGRRRRGGAAVPRRLARSRGVGAGAAVRQRPAGHADADPPRAQARRTVSRGDDRRRQPDRVAPGVCRRPRARSRAASRRASRRSPTCASSARCCSARALRCR